MRLLSDPEVVPACDVGGFVGRAAELDLVDRVCARAAAGRRQVVVVSGEPGIGKTRFCDRVASQAELAGFAVVWGRCWPHGGTPPLWPWPAVLAGLIGAAGTRPLSDEPAFSEVDPERFARFAAVAASLSRHRADRPTMVVIDDLQAADVGALLLTRFLARTLDRLPLVLVLARRNGPTPTGGEADGLLGDLERDATVVPLRRFDLDETTAFLATHGLGDIDRDLASALRRITGGNPLFLSRAITNSSTPPGLGGVEHAIGAALTQLDPAERRMLGLLAVLGTSAPGRDVAILAEQPAAVVLAALGAAERAGLVAPEQDDGYAFTHELVRQAALGTLSPTQRLDAHARAAALVGTSPSQLARRAHHALGAASRSHTDTDLAIDACRTAAQAMTRGYDYEQAAALLGRATALATNRPPSAALADLLTERAEAVLACGRLAAARTAFAEAAAVADSAQQPTLLARAVLGLGGVWLNEHRDTLVRERVLAMQRAALDGLPERERALRCRLSTRLAAEAVYDGGPVEPVLTALAAARRLGDQRALAEALSLAYHALLTPEHTASRLPLADELVRVASAAGDGVLALMGLLWRTVDLYHRGDPEAERALADLRERSDALGSQNIIYIVAAIDVMRLVRAGRLDEAETAAADCHQLGVAVGDNDATGYYGGQLASIRWLQDRDAEILDAVEDFAVSPTLVAAEFALRATVAAMAARAGRLDDARAALDRLVAGGLASLPTSSTWLTGMVAIVEAAYLLDDETVAAQAYRLLAPFAGLPVMPSLAITCLGPADRALGLAALTIGDVPAAVGHLEHAVSHGRRLRNRPVTTLARASLADALAARDAPGDLDRAVALLHQAQAEAADMNLHNRAHTYAERAAHLNAAGRRGNTTATGLARRQNGTWTLETGDRKITVPDLVGVGYLVALLERPGEEIPAVDLCGAGMLDASRHSLVDAQALRSYRRRLHDIDDELAEADASCDIDRSARLQVEHKALTEQLAQSLGLGGRIRTFTSSHERARTAVRKAIKRALDAIAATDPDLGTELRTSVTTGTTCKYTPHPSHARTWTVSSEN